MNSKKVFIAIFLVLFSIITALTFIVLWGKTPDYFTLATAEPSGDIKIDYVDLTQEQIYSIIIPKDTEVALAMQRGNLRASSIEKLLKTENLPGQFLADTTMKTFHFPVDYWRHGMSTDLPLVLLVRQKVMGWGRSKIEKINLSDTTYLVEQKLTDGEVGYVVRDAMPLLLQSIFADPAFSKDYTAIQIVNKTGQHQYYLHNFVKVLEVMGVKVAPISDGDKEAEIDCIAKSLDRDALERIASVFNCDTLYAEPSAFDVEIIVGERFYKRF